MTDLSTWFSQEQACVTLQCSPRTLNERIQRGSWTIEKRPRPIEGRKPEPCYNPSDVNRIAEELAPKAAVFAPGSGVGPGHEMTKVISTPVENVATVVDRVADRTLALLERLTIQRKERGPWLTVNSAAMHSGLSKTMVRRIVRRLLEAGSSEVIEDGALKIRQSALEEFDGAALRKWGGAEHAAEEAADTSAESQADQTARPMLSEGQVEVAGVVRILATAAAL